jgi:hypothetical protein
VEGRKCILEQGDYLESMNMTLKSYLISHWKIVNQSKPNLSIKFNELALHFLNISVNQDF